MIRFFFRIGVPKHSELEPDYLLAKGNGNCDGSRVKSTYVGRGEIADLISQFQASSTVVERIACRNKTIESKEKEAALDLVAELIQLVTSAALLSAGFHTHKRQWRRKRNAGN